MGSSARARLQKERTKVESLASHACLQSPDYFVQSRQESLELTAERLHAAMPRLVDRRKEETSRQATSLNGAGARLLSPFEVSLSALSGRLDVAALEITASHEATLARAAAQLEALSPLKVLARGYTLVRDDDGHVITKAAQLSGGEKIEVSFTDGKAKATVTDVSAEPVG
jgi:exodeoxyribonuclease VII large subunit